MRGLPLFVLLIVAALASGPARAEGCAPGYMAARGTCILHPPAHAVVDPHGGWTCASGYYDADGRCPKVDLPRNARLSAYGHTWECNDGFVEVDGKCLPQDTPVSAAPVVTVACERGYEPVRNTCVPMRIPRNATLSDGGHGWACNPGYQNVNGLCVPTEIPPNARLSTYGWICNWGYARSHNKCQFIDVPNNATLGFYGDAWSCNRGYYEVRGVCLVDNRPKPAKTQSSLQDGTAPPPPRSVAHFTFRTDNSRMRAIVGFATLIGGALVIFLLRPPPVVVSAPHRMNYVPRKRRSDIALTWRSFGNRIDALTGAPLAPSEPTARCRNCRAWYHADSAAALRRENAARCVACGRAALAHSANDAAPLAITEVRTAT